MKRESQSDIERQRERQQGDGWRAEREGRNQEKEIEKDGGGAVVEMQKRFTRLARQTRRRKGSKELEAEERKGKEEHGRK